MEVSPKDKVAILFESEFRVTLVSDDDENAT